MREQIQHMQRLQLAGFLSGGIAHDLNNELTLVLGSLELLMDRLPSTHRDAYDRLELASHAAARCADLSRRLSRFAGSSPGLGNRMDVAAVIVEAVQMIECVKPANTRIAVECATGLFIAGDSLAIQQVVMNLCLNAFHAMEHGGQVQIRASLQDGKVIVSVIDSGHGIAASIRKRIFEPFFTTHADTGSSGLGLASVSSIVNAHGGQVACDSHPGEGTVFVLTFPALEPAADQPQAA